MESDRTESCQSQGNDSDSDWTPKKARNGGAPISMTGMYARLFIFPACLDARACTHTNAAYGF